MLGRFTRNCLATCGALLLLGSAGQASMASGFFDKLSGFGPNFNGGQLAQIIKNLQAKCPKGGSQSDLLKKLLAFKSKGGISADLAAKLQILSSKGGITLPASSKKVDSLIFLLPDTAVLTDPHVTIWTDAMAEEGLQFTILRDSDFLKPGFDSTQYAGVILPDGVHVNAGDDLIAALQTYATNGGKLMLVFDAGSLTSTGFYPVPKSRLSQLVGIDYALYDELRDKTFGYGTVAGTEKTFTALRVPPGKFTPYDGTFTDVPIPVDAPDGKVSTVDGFAASYFAATGYIYGYLSYPGFVTRGAYAGTPLLTSPAFGLAAGYNTYGKGGVLFVNMPLGYLKQQTDGVFMHGFLHYFAADLLHLPYLSSVPDGEGGLVMNIHVDSSLAEEPLTQLQNMGVFDQGPYSIDVTAGPDTIAFGDGIGLDLPHNPQMQQFLHGLADQGHQIGSHGGWIHDYFGLNVSETNQTDFEPLLVLNKNAVEAATGRPVLEYAAPVGNQPEWVTTWLEQRGVLAYYFVGNTGMSPTRSYRNGRLLNKTIWSVPLSTFGKAATFEDFEAFGITSNQASTWLLSLTNFAVQQRVSRMVYYHPPGVVDFPDALQTWLARAAQFQRQGKFRWYTMTQMAQFMSRREKATWSTYALPDGTRVFQASHPTSLQNMTWVLPKAYYDRPVITKGTASIIIDTGHARPKIKLSKGATVTGDSDEWVVTAQAGQDLQFTARPIAP